MIRALLEADAAGSSAPDTSGASPDCSVPEPANGPPESSAGQARTFVRQPGSRLLWPRHDPPGGLADELGTDAQVYAIRFSCPLDAFQWGLDPVVLLHLERRGAHDPDHPTSSSSPRSPSSIRCNAIPAFQSLWRLSPAKRICGEVFELTTLCHKSASPDWVETMTEKLV